MPSTLDPRAVVSSGTGKLALQATTDSYYLLDQFTTPKTSAPILDVVESSTGQVVTNGSFIIRVPTPLRVSPSPATLSNLLTAKYAALLAKYPAYTRITYDAMLDATGVNLATPPSGFFGERGTVSIKTGTTLQSVATALTGGAPTSAMIVYELFTYTYSDPKGGRLIRTYNQLASTTGNATVTASFNNGSTYIGMTDSVNVSIGGGDQGTNFILRIANISGAMAYVGSWAVLY